jgi:5'-methylthioadenosine phosphorylase
MCVVNISLITDYDSGLHGNVEPVTHAQVMKVFAENLTKLQTLLLKLIESIPQARDKCKCAQTLAHARF